MKLYLQSILLLCICSVVCNTYGQYSDFRFENIGREQGLASGIVNTIIQDETGFIWIGSQDGLTRYDGYSCTIFTHNNRDNNSLPDNEVRALCGAANGILWIGTRNGLCRYNRNTGLFENFFHDDSDKNSLSGNEIFALAKDKEGNIWIGTYGAGINFLPATETKKEQLHFIHYNTQAVNKNISSDLIFSIGIDKQQRAWVGTSNGLNIIDRKKNSILKFYHTTKENSISNNSVYRIYIDTGNTAWLTGARMIDRIQINDHDDLAYMRIQHMFPGNNNFKGQTDWNINELTVDKNGFIWVGTNDEGLFKCKLRNDQLVTVEKYISREQLTNELQSSLIDALCVDRSGVIWIGNGNNVSKYVPSKNLFNTLGLQKTGDLLSAKIINTIYSDHTGNIWIGSDSDTLTVLQTSNADLFAKKIALPSKANPGLDEVNTFYESSDSNMYIGTLQNGFYIIPVKSISKGSQQKWMHISKETFKTLPVNNIYSFAEDKIGNVYIGTYKGICRFDPRTKKLDSIYTSGISQSASDHIIRCLLIMNDTLWCGTDNGLLLFKDSKLLARFTNDKNDSSSVNSNGIVTLFKDKNDNVWIGTKSGLNLYNRKFKNFQRFDNIPALNNNIIRSILEDEHNNFWIGTNNGLLKYNLQTQRIQDYTVADGLCSEQFQSNSAVRALLHTFCFATSEGIISFDPGKIKENEFIPPVVITAIDILNKPLSQFYDSAVLNRFYKEGRLILKYDENFFSFEFAALNFINSNANMYAHKLEGIDKDWNFTGTKRTAEYTDIKPGTYFFKAKAANNDGAWNEEAITIPITILPPWWQTWWFYSICVLMLCAIIYMIYRIRLKQILKLYKLRSSIAKDLHDDVGSALSSIALLSKIAQEEKMHSRLKPEEIFTCIGDTSKRMIDLMDDIVWSVNPDNDRFANMLVRMREYAAEMLEAKNISFEFVISEQVDELKIPMQMRKDYFLVFKEAINNLAKYSCATEASVILEKKQNSIFTIIKDNGQGFDLAITHSGNGLKNMQQRAQALHGTLTIASERNNGTNITLQMPVP